MKYLSVCSGIEAATTAWHSLGWEPVAFSEIEPFPSAVLAHHWPDVPNLGDMTKFDEWSICACNATGHDSNNQPAKQQQPAMGRPNAHAKCRSSHPGGNNNNHKTDELCPTCQRPPIDLLVGGTPCQSFSVAGLRKGLEDPRGNLTLTFLAMVDRFRPSWVVWENVPGVLSDRSNAFGQLLSGLGELGYQYAYRVLDAQHFGVPQRRRRVFVVASAGAVHPAAVLFEPESLCRDLTPRREAGEDVAKSLRGRPNASQREDSDTYIPEVAETGKTWPVDVAPCLNTAYADKLGLEDQHALGGAGLFVPSVVGALTAKGPAGNGAPEVDAGHYIPEVANTLTARMHKGFNTPLDEGQTPVVTHTLRAEGHDASEDGTGRGTPVVPVAFTGDGVTADPISAAEGKTYTHEGSTFRMHNCVQIAGVRRLTPTECERLQGFPDDHTLIPWRNKPADQCPDGPRYKALGNSMAVPVMRWIGERIQATTKP